MASLTLEEAVEDSEEERKVEVVPVNEREEARKEDSVGEAEEGED